MPRFPHGKPDRDQGIFHLSRKLPYRAEKYFLIAANLRSGGKEGKVFLDVAYTGTLLVAGAVS
jgi:hypothetical protein